MFQIPPWKGFLGITLDRSYGLVPNFPLFVLAIPGVILSWRTRPNLVIGITVLPYLLAISTFSMWWGGYSPPARFLVVVAPLLSYYVAVTLQRIHHWILTTAAILAALFALALAVVGDLVPAVRWNWHEWPQGAAMRRLGELAGMPFVRFVPSSFGAHQAWTFVWWALAVAVVTAVLWYAGNRPAAVQRALRTSQSHTSSTR